MDLSGLRILEVGCGLALAGIVAHSKGYEVVVSDFHPMVEEFLNRNTALNRLEPMVYCEANWTKEYPDLGLFDVIMGSDVLYDREHPVLLASFMAKHLKQTARVIITDPGRQGYRVFVRELERQGFTTKSQLVRSHVKGSSENSSKVHILTFVRP